MSWEAAFGPKVSDEVDLHMKRTVAAMEDATVVVTLWDGAVSAKMATEIGTCVLLGKPMIALAKRGTEIPAQLREIAVEVIEYDTNPMSASPEVMAVAQRLQEEGRI